MSYVALMNIRIMLPKKKNFYIDYFEIGLGVLQKTLRVCLWKNFFKDKIILFEIFLSCFLFKILRFVILFLQLLIF